MICIFFTKVRSCIPRVWLWVPRSSTKGVVSVWGMIYEASSWQNVYSACGCAYRPSHPSKRLSCTPKNHPHERGRIELFALRKTWNAILPSIRASLSHFTRMLITSTKRMTTSAHARNVQSFSDSSPMCVAPPLSTGLPLSSCAATVCHAPLRLSHAGHKSTKRVNACTRLCVVEVGTWVLGSVGHSNGWLVWFLVSLLGWKMTFNIDFLLPSSCLPLNHSLYSCVCALMHKEHAFQNDLSYKIPASWHYWCGTTHQWCNEMVTW